MYLNLNTTQVIWQRISFRPLVKYLVLGLLLALMWWQRHWLGEMWVLLGDRERLIEFVGQYGPLASLLIGILLVLQVIVAVIPGHALMVSGGFLFGFGPAFALNLATTVLGSQIAFQISRRSGRPVVERLVAAEQLDKWDRVARNKGTLFFLLSFMIPVFPADVMNYVAGMSALTGRKFFVANFIGRIPGVVLLTLLGSHGFELPLTVWLGVLPLSLLMMWLLHKFPVVQS
ncbi:MAG: TVP38/TMEM64 family protein [Anaerolineales bacterium]|nr:TVP38/TMEM64 family protein [Anaerolineales bacterium]MCB0028892.1 TVP38/TMEM64 family protein [Anaerolineales bacterium]